MRGDRRPGAPPDARRGRPPGRRRVVRAPPSGQTLATGDPGIFVNVEQGGISINTHCLRDGDAEQIATRLRTLLRTMV